MSIVHSSIIIQLLGLVYDSTGSLILGISNYSHCALSPTEVEAWGLYEAKKFAIDRGMQSVTFESDCKVVVDSVNSCCALQNEIGDIISGCNTFLSSRISYVVKHIRRQVNMIVHSIARASLSHPSPYIFDDVPQYLYSLITNEMA